MASVGVRLGKYQLEQQLAGNGLATTFYAKDTETRKRVVIKVLWSYFSQEHELFARFAEQMKRVRSAPFPGVLQPLEEHDEEQSWFSREYADAPSLEDSWKTPGSAETVVQIIESVAAAQEHLLALGVPHANLKPSNIFWDPAHGMASLADVGLATLGRGIHPLMRTATTSPLPSFMAPEYADDGEPDARTEVFSLAVLAYWLLTGEVPYIAEATSTMYAKAMRHDALPPSQINASVPPEFDRTILRALAPFPAARPASPAIFAFELRAILSGSAQSAPLVAAPASVWAPPIGRALSSATQRIFVPQETRVPRPIWGEDSILDRLRRAPRPRNPLRERAVQIGMAVFLVGAIAVNYGVSNYTPPMPPLTSSVTSPVAAQSWVLPRHDLQNSGYAPVISGSIKGELAWQLKTSEAFFSSPTAADGVVYTTTGDKRLMALDAATGSTIWESPLSGPVDAAPALGEDMVYVGLRDSHMVAFDRKTGERRWEFRTGNPNYSAPVIQDGVLYMGSADSHLYALDAATGEQRWKFNAGAWISTSPSISENNVAVLGRDGWLHTINKATGKEVFSFFGGGSTNSSPALVGETAYMTTSPNRLFAVDLTERSTFKDWEIYNIQVRLFIWGMWPELPHHKGRIWGGAIPGRGLSAPAVANGRVYLGTDKGRLMAIDTETGKKVWEYEGGTPLLGAPTVTKDRVYIGGRDGTVHAIDLTTGKAQWTFAAQDKVYSSPAISNNMIFITSYDGSLYALK